MPQRASQYPRLVPQPPRADGAGGAPATPFWNEAIGAGAELVVSCMEGIDSLSARIAQLPPRSATTLPMVSDYIAMVQTLALAWPARNRPALAAALNALKHCCDQFIGKDAALLAASFQRIAAGDVQACQLAARQLGLLAQELNVPLALLDAVNGEFRAYLSHMAAASNDLESDTALVTQRLQADHVHASILGRHMLALQEELDAAQARQRAASPGTSTGQARKTAQEIDTVSARLLAAERQLERIRTAQAATLADAAYLQGLLPALASYLSGVDQLGGGIHAALSGVEALRRQLGQFGASLGDAGTPVIPLGALAVARLQDALPDWRYVAAKIGQLAPA